MTTPRASQTLVEQIRAISTHERHLVAEAYCRAPACAVREVTLRITDHDRTLVEAVGRRGGLCCPACAAPMALHWIVSGRDRQIDLERHARMSVNTQMYERDVSACIPATVMVRDDLPPAPPDWWTTEAEDVGRREPTSRSDVGHRNPTYVGRQAPS